MPGFLLPVCGPADSAPVRGPGCLRGTVLRDDRLGVRPRSETCVEIEGHCPCETLDVKGSVGRF